MLKKIAGLLDLALSLVLAGLFLLAAAILLVVSKIVPFRRKDYRQIRELYLSIVDVRETVISTLKEDILLKGFKKKIFLYHFEFEKTGDEASDFGENIHVAI